MASFTIVHWVNCEYIVYIEVKNYIITCWLVLRPFFMVCCWLFKSFEQNFSLVQLLCWNENTKYCWQFLDDEKNGRDIAIFWRKMNFLTLSDFKKYTEYKTFKDILKQGSKSKFQWILNCPIWIFQSIPQTFSSRFFSCNSYLCWLLV